MFEGRWTWCKLCACAKIRCPDCGNISCSGGGCEMCKDEFAEAIRMSGDGTAPTMEQCLADKETIERDEEIARLHWN